MYDDDEGIVKDASVPVKIRESFTIYETDLALMFSLYLWLVKYACVTFHMFTFSIVL